MEFDSSLKEFVRHLCRLRRSDEQIVAVARATRWRSALADVVELLERKGKRWRAEGRNGK